MKAIINSNSRIVERIVQNKNGQFFRAYFLVAEFEGKIFWKLVKVVSLKNEDFDKKDKVVCLPVFGSDSELNVTSYKLNVVFSPYFLNTFFTSQMTRAPSN